MKTKCGVVGLGVLVIVGLVACSSGGATSDDGSIAADPGAKDEGPARLADGGTPSRSDGGAPLPEDPSRPGAPATTGGSRLKARAYHATDGSKLVMPYMFDSELNANCSFQLASDGKTRCLPGGGAGGFFSDAACSTPLTYAINGECGSTMGEFASVPSSACGGVQIYRVAGPFVGGTVYSRFGATCSAYPIPATHSFFSLGPAMSPSQFVEASLTTE